MTLVPHHCACPGQPGAQLPANILGSRSSTTIQGSQSSSELSQIDRTQPITNTERTHWSGDATLAQEQSHQHRPPLISAESPNHQQPKSHHLLQSGRSRAGDGRGPTPSRSRLSPQVLLFGHPFPRAPLGSQRMRSSPSSSLAPVRHWYTKLRRAKAFCCILVLFILSFLSKSVLVQYLLITIDGFYYIAVRRNNKSLLHVTVFQGPLKLERYFTCAPGRGHALNGDFEKH